MSVRQRRKSTPRSKRHNMKLIRKSQKDGDLERTTRSTPIESNKKIASCNRWAFLLVVFTFASGIACWLRRGAMLAACTILLTVYFGRTASAAVPVTPYFAQTERIEVRQAPRQSDPVPRETALHRVVTWWARNPPRRRGGSRTKAEIALARKALRERTEREIDALAAEFHAKLPRSKAKSIGAL